MKERWKKIPEYDGLYEASSLGRVRSLKYFKRRDGEIVTFLKGVLNTKGYPQVRLYKNKKASIKRIHRIIAELFIRNPKGLPQVNHKDGDKTNNTIKNLEWCTNLQNQHHSWKKLGRSGKKGKRKSNLSKRNI